MFKPEKEISENVDRYYLIGRENSRKCMQMIINAKAGRNDSQLFINSLSSRNRSFIYFVAGLHIEKRRLKFESLCEYDRRKVISALRELRDLFSQIPKTLSDADSFIN